MMHPVVRVLAAALLAALAVAAPVAADEPQGPSGASVEPQRQPAPPPSPDARRDHSFYVAFGADFLLSQGLGSSPGTLVANNSSTTPYTYFNTSATRTAGPGFRASVGYAVRRAIAIEGSVNVGRGDLQVTPSNDAEQATPATASATLTQYIIDVAAVFRLGSFAGGSGMPFVEGGGGYLRQLHAGNAALESGSIFHFGGGVLYFFGQQRRGHMSGLGIRADARVYFPRSGYTTDSSQHPFAAVGAGLVIGF